MTASAQRARAATFEARAARLERICAMFSGRAAHLRKTDMAGAIALQCKADRAAEAEANCLFKAFGCKLAAASLEHQAARTADLFGVAA